MVVICALALVASALAWADDAAVSRGPLTLRFDAATQKLAVTDARTGLTWASDAPALALVVGETKLKAERAEVTRLGDGTGLRVRLSDFGVKKPVFFEKTGFSATSRASVAFDAALTETSVRLRLDPVDNPAEEGISRVDFPNRFGQTGEEPSGYLVLPLGLGGIRPFERGDFRWDTRVYANGSHGLNMALLGKVLASPTETGPAIVAVFHTAFDCGLRLETRVFTPRWAVQTKPTLLEGNERRFQVSYAREVEYHFLPRAGYVECAKLYRRHLIAQGVFRTLRERLKDQPELQHHVGAIIKKQYNGPVFDNGEIAKARELGVKKCVWVMGGWNFGGYDRLYPQRLPPNPKMRSPDGIPGEEGLRRTVALAREAGYLFTVHDNYSDAYRDSAEWSESYLAMQPNGERQKGGVWGGGQAWIVCPQEQLRFARRDLPRIRALLGRGGYFIDVTGAAGLSACYDPAHPHDARRSAELKRELLGLAKSEFGVIYTEGLYDFLIPTADGCHKIFIPTGAKHAPHEDALAVPLLPLVFHDAIILWDLRRSNPARAKDPKADKYLPLDGYVPLYGAMPAMLDAAGKHIAEAMSDTQLTEMLDHRFLAEGVEATTFADSTRVVANFRDTPYDDRGHAVAAHGFRISK